MEQEQTSNTDSSSNNGRLFLLRGVSGSGKSSLAQNLLKQHQHQQQSQNKKDGIILSTDDFFQDGDQYHYNNHSLQRAHAWNQVRCEIVMKNGFSPIIM